jgi:hypothetical protein
LHLGGDGGPRPTAVLLSVAASVKRHSLHPWAYLTHILSELPVRTPGADLLPDAWAKSRGETRHRAGRRRTALCHDRYGGEGNRRQPPPRYSLNSPLS